MQRKERSREGGCFFFGQTFLMWRLRPYAGLSSGLVLLLMCSSSGNMKTTQRLGIGDVADYGLWRMANGKYIFNIFLLHRLTWLGAAMLLTSGV